MKQNRSLKIGWFYPELMSTYGDSGNIRSLQSRCNWRGIEVEIIKIDQEIKNPPEVDLFFMGGAQDRQQEIVKKDLFKKSEFLRAGIEKGLPGLFICGAYQFLGKYYITAEGTVIDGLGIFDLYTENPGSYKKRLIGDVIIEAEVCSEKIVGFENHGGRTYLSKEMKPFAQVIHGFGNNGIDKTEGIIYKNSIGTYLHGPVLPKNPALSDWLIEKALSAKYDESVTLQKLDDNLEKLAREAVIFKYEK